MPHSAKFRNCDFRKTLVFDNFLKKLQDYLMLLFLKSIISDKEPSSLWLFDFVLCHIHLSPHSFQKNWYDHKKFWSFHQISPIALGGWCHSSTHWKWNTEKYSQYLHCRNNRNWLNWCWFEIYDTHAGNKYTCPKKIEYSWQSIKDVLIVMLEPHLVNNQD